MTTRDHAVVLVHGIRTRAEWQQQVAHVLEADPHIRAVPTSYEFLDVFRFLLPLQSVRQRPSRRIAKLIRYELSKPTTRRLSVMAHSYGSWIIKDILENEADIPFYRMILCGSVIPNDFEWERYAHRIGQDPGTEWKVVNDCGSKDIWPVLAQSMTWGYGSSGRYGFGHGAVKDRFHTAAHGDFFSVDFVRKFWLPYLSSGIITPGLSQRAPTPWYLSVLSVVKIRSLAILIVALYVLSLVGLSPVQTAKSVRNSAIVKFGFGSPNQINSGASSEKTPQTGAISPPATGVNFEATVNDYLKLTAPERQPVSAAKASGMSGAELVARKDAFARVLTARLRPGATQGNFFTPEIAATIERDLAVAFDGRHDVLADALKGATTGNVVPSINGRVEGVRMPIQLLDAVPPLPPELEYVIVGRTLVVKDFDADVVIDYLPDAIPGIEDGRVVKPTRKREFTGPDPLPLPVIIGAPVFALIGNSGAAGDPQKLVSRAMISYFNTKRRFSFVLMLGNNLFTDDYQHEFLEPYKRLIDDNVRFYAVLGNRDASSETHFELFNMKDREYYSFQEGPVRFAALYSNRPTDRDQQNWLDSVFAGVTNEWRIILMHHDLYSSGSRATSAEEVMRPALEPVFIRNRVNVVFSADDRNYQRFSPKSGIVYFVSGGGGNFLRDVQPTEAGEVAMAEHQFMVVEIAGDSMFFETITQRQRLLDCGVVYRTAEAKGTAEPYVRKWSDDCESARKLVRPVTPIGS